MGTSSALMVLFFACAIGMMPTLVQPGPKTQNWLLFDGVCNLCDGFVNLVADHDSRDRIKFGALQKHKDLLIKHGAGQYAEGGAEELSTVVFVQGDQVHVRSTAALRVLAMLDFPYNSLAVFLLLPTPVRDWAYKLVAQYRYVVFGKTDSCRAPTERFKQRFIEYQPKPGATKFSGQ